jgi:hypothetical protein
MKNERELAFNEWMRELDILVQTKVGLRAQDLSSSGYRTAFDDDLTPTEAFEEEVVPQLRDLGFHVEIAELFDDAMYFGSPERLAASMAAEAGLEYLTEGPFDLTPDELEADLDDRF